MNLEGDTVAANDYLRTALHLEKLILTLPGVRGAKVEAEDEGIRSVRVLVMPERHTESTIREIRSLAAGELGAELDPGIIHILRAGGDPEKAPPRPARRRLASIMTERSESAFKTRVTLEMPGDVLIGESESHPGQLFEHRSVARAIVVGLKDLLAFPVEVEAVNIIRQGDRALALVFLDRESDRLVGSALVHTDEHDAIARATLDALNRFLGVSELSSATI
ncbi:MAG: hypothetical protein ACRDLB_11670 [Actinomycetota bacterium]